MSKPPSTETLLRSERAKVRALTNSLEGAKQLAAHYRARATTAEQELAEWKRRFDALLKIVQEPKP